METNKTDLMNQVADMLLELNTLCKDDPALRKEIVSMLAAGAEEVTKHGCNG